MCQEKDESLNLNNVSRTGELWFWGCHSWAHKCTPSLPKTTLEIKERFIKHIVTLRSRHAPRSQERSGIQDPGSFGSWRIFTDPGSWSGILSFRIQWMSIDFQTKKLIKSISSHYLNNNRFKSGRFACLPVQSNPMPDRRTAAANDTTRPIAW